MTMFLTRNKQKPYLIVGLGNPEPKYKNTRHNVGFEVVNLLGNLHGLTIKKAKYKALTGQGMILGRYALLAKPQTFMNLSGVSVASILHGFKLIPSEMMVVFDDVNLPLGDVRMRLKGSAGGHKGMISIMEHIGTDEFVRIRVGIGAKPQGWDLADYVLGRFNEEETAIIRGGIQKAAQAVESMLEHGQQTAMNMTNQRAKDGGSGGLC